MKILILIVAITLLCTISCTTAALADYNPATGEDELLLIGETQEVQIGRSLAKGVEEKFCLVSDAGMQNRVAVIGEKIANVCDRPELTYSFTVIEGEDMEEEERYNAFALPGGYVYIFKDMVKYLESDDELAAILAHEVGHIVARHSIKKLQSSIGMAGLNLLGAIAKSDRRTQQNTSIAVAQLMMAYNRQAEFEADKLSIRYLKKAGFNPKAAVSLVDRMLEKNLKGQIHQYRYFRSHPYTSERKAMLNKEIGGGFAFDDYINAPIESRETYW